MKGARSRQPGSSYRVGYKRPPVETRFKPGQSGNPKGRRVQSKNPVSLLKRELQSTITIDEGGKTKHLTKLELILKVLIAGALKGNARCIDQLFKLMHNHDLFRVLESDLQKIVVEFVSPSGGRDNDR